MPPGHRLVRTQAIIEAWVQVRVRQPQGKATPLFGLVDDADVAPVALNEGLGDGEPEIGAVDAIGTAAEEGVEEPA